MEEYPQVSLAFASCASFETLGFFFSSKILSIKLLELLLPDAAALEAFAAPKNTHKYRRMWYGGIHGGKKYEYVQHRQ